MNGIGDEVLVKKRNIFKRQYIIKDIDIIQDTIYLIPKCINFSIIHIVFMFGCYENPTLK